MGDRKRLRIVPRSVFSATFASVVPVCVAAVSCGGSTTSPGKGDASNADVQFLGVAAACFDACPMAVATDAFVVPDVDAGSSNDASDANVVPDVFLGVAACCFDGGNQG
jgi:hypothetical protein